MILKACHKYIYSIRAELSPAYTIPISVAFSLIVISLPFLGGRSLFKTRKLVKCLPKLYLFTTWSNIALPDFIGMSVKLANYN